MRRKLAEHLFLLVSGRVYLLIIWRLRASRATPSLPRRVSTWVVYRVGLSRPPCPEPCVWFQGQPVHNG